MKKIAALCLSSMMILAGCNFGSGGGNNNTSKENKVVDDALLRVTPELKEDHDNPVILPAAHGSSEAADPFVYRFNGKYYLYMTTGSTFVRCYVSDDLLTWEPSSNGPASGVCYQATSGNNIGNTPYAPEVIYHNGYFYMVTSPSGNGHHILVAESPEGPFRDITGNVEKSIDGSLFIDEDEQAYMFTAGGNSIVGYHVDLNPEEVTFDGYMMPYSDTHIGGWNEGPYMLKRYGAYYLTHTGTHYLSPAYRVNYVYAPKGSEAGKSSSFAHVDNMNTLVATEDDFHALGHSSTVLGPDMDSYYIAYHSMKGNSSFRYYNINRLSFNGGNMVINEYGTQFNQAPSMPEYAVSSSEDMDLSSSRYLSNKEHNEDAFSAEWNVIGEGKMYFGYQDDRNYGYLEFKDNHIILGKVSGGKSSTIKNIALIKEYDTEVLHTFRINYGYGKAAIYFDSIEKDYDIACSFSSGKLGVDASFDDIQYCAFSNVGGGKSDKVEYNSKKILANAYDDERSILNGDKSGISYVSKGMAKITDNGMMSLSKLGDRATYLMRQNADGQYHVALRIPSSMLGKKLGLRLNDGEVMEITIPNNTPKVNNGDVYLNITTLDLEYNEYWFSIVNVGDDVSFYEIDFEAVCENPDYNFDLTSDFNSNGAFIRRNEHTFSGSSLLVRAEEADATGFISKAKLDNPYASVTFKLTGDMDMFGFVSLLANVNNYNNSTSYDGNSPYMQQGYMLKAGVDSIKLVYVDYNFTTNLATSYETIDNNVNYELSMEIENNHIVCYLNGEEIINVYANIGRLSGQVGVLSYKTDAQISHFEAC